MPVTLACPVWIRTVPRGPGSSPGTSAARNRRLAQLPPPSGLQKALACSGCRGSLGVALSKLPERFGPVLVGFERLWTVVGQFWQIWKKLNQTILIQRRFIQFLLLESIF